MNFIINKDYSVTIRKEVEAVVARSQSIKEDAELIAVSLASGYLGNRYDTAKIFKDISIYNASTQYVEGDLATNSAEDGDALNYNAIIYEALGDTTGDGLGDVTKWVAKDPRNKALVSRVLDIALYEMHCSINPRNVPELRDTRYTDAIKWLEMVSKGSIKLDLPLLQDADGEDIKIFRASSNKPYTERF